MSAVMNMPETLDDQGEGRWQQFLIGGVIVALLVMLVWWGINSMSHSSSGPKRQTVKIAVLPDTPPPPPPPKPDKPPEPEKQELKQTMQQEQPKPQEAQPAPAQLKMDGPAGDGPSAFAAGQVSAEYKGGEIGTGTGGVNKLQFALFTNQLQKHIQLQLAKNTAIKLGDYRVNVQVVLSPSGDFQRVELLSSTGDPQADEALQSALNHMAPMRDVPANLPQPVRLRITNRMTG
jgi:protein TonB